MADGVESQAKNRTRKNHRNRGKHQPFQLAKEFDQLQETTKTIKEAQYDLAQRNRQFEQLAATAHLSLLHEIKTLRLLEKKTEEVSALRKSVYGRLETNGTNQPTKTACCAFHLRKETEQIQQQQQFGPATQAALKLIKERQNNQVSYSENAKKCFESGTFLPNYNKCKRITGEISYLSNIQN